ncbi:phosphatase PAP2 family protein [Cryobacterium sp. TMT1-3]|uniref:Phosphatase PAP2 family protein n=1 Tax=Cryobacterium luteum TaxID=1424661 RepID=A0A1H8JB87_9MICO|nr:MULTISPECIES: phosphatase PAP2 family protein [Cryobacterium]TFB92362.1 phosphatase PAP2 family protein [Cryobacterium luteum]TFC25082.1 phosphatase PAP2 family protein [Cryobacterium sp. TMT1-3]SEN77457.1 undecaprenyl-diphosphatase [Cryobacterium luteum]
MVSARHPEHAAIPRAQRVTRRWPLISGLGAVALSLGLGVLVLLRGTADTADAASLAIDRSWLAWIDRFRGPALDSAALVLNYLGFGLTASLLIPALIVAVLLLARRFWAVGFYLAATMLTGGAVQVIKRLFARTRPQDILVTVDFGSFPSGHVANAAAMATIFVLLFPRWWVGALGAAYTLAMMISRTYLGAHWLTDTIGALLLGTGIAVVVWAPLAAKLDGEYRLRADRRPH